MDNEDTINRIADLERQIAQLPSGSIAKKTIKGHVYHYHRITSNGNSKETYIPEGNVKQLSEQIDRRRRLESELRRLTASLPKETAIPSCEEPPRYNMQVLTADSLVAFAKPVESYRKRDCYKELLDFLRGPDMPRILALYGLRRTGKTTLIRQAIASISKKEARKAAFIQTRSTNSLADLNADLRTMAAQGLRYIFIDEITLMADFIEGAALLSDIYASMGLKIVLSGTDSLGIMLSTDDQLFDRCTLVHTTFIPYREFSRVLGVGGIDSYINFGGTMCLERANYQNPSPFENETSTAAYIDSAIAVNIQHSLEHYQSGGHFGGLRTLYDRHELTSAINRIIEDANHRFAVDVLTRTFRSHDLALSARNLRNDRQAPSDILDQVDKAKVTEGLKRALKILDAHEQSVDITTDHVAQIQEYLELLDLVVDIDLFHLPGKGTADHIAVIAQPGLRYAQVKELISNLVQDDRFDVLNPYERKAVERRILDEVRGRMMEEIVLLETKMALPDMRVFKLEFNVGEFDMVVWDTEALTCKVYEVKHSTVAIPQQAHHLVDADKCAKTEHRFGKIVGKYVIYRGEAKPADDQGVEYLNVEEYLEGLGDVRER